MQRPRVKAAALAAVAAFLLAACSSGPHTTPTVTAHSPTSRPGSPTTLAGGPGSAASGTHAELTAGTQGDLGSVPWKSVGPGWLLATWSPDTATGQIRPPRRPRPPRSRSSWSTRSAAATWSPHSRRAQPCPSPTGRGTASGPCSRPGTHRTTALAVLDLRTGQSGAAFSVGPVTTAAFTRPRRPGHPGRRHAPGRPHPQALQPGRHPAAHLPDHLQPGGGLRRVLPARARTGPSCSWPPPPGWPWSPTPARSSPSSRSPDTSYCQPTRWWAPGVALASCMTGGRRPAPVGGPAARAPRPRP